MSRPEPLLPPSDTLNQQYRSRLWVAPGPNGFCMFFVRPRPNWWYRMWQRVFFGFIWEEIDEQNETR
jgi:hypothetical protein